MYECHITIEPILDELKLESIKQVVKSYSFRVADLLMCKRQEDTPERSKYDTFMTGHSKKYDDLQERMANLVSHLTQQGIKVYRYKIEAILLDSREVDSLGLLT